MLPTSPVRRSSFVSSSRPATATPSTHVSWRSSLRAWPNYRCRTPQLRYDPCGCVSVCCARAHVPAWRHVWCPAPRSHRTTQLSRRLASRVTRLRLLGKFLGFLLFSPQWSSTSEVYSTCVPLSGWQPHSSFCACTVPLTSHTACVTARQPPPAVALWRCKRTCATLWHRPTKCDPPWTCARRCAGPHRSTASCWWCRGLRKWWP